MAEYNANVQKYREALVAIRTRHEQQVDQWWNQLKGIDPMYHATLELPENVSLREMVPEIYKDDPDPKVYLQQMEELNALFARVDVVGEQYRQETQRCMQELQALISSGM